jgi:hypothetical protein
MHVPFGALVIPWVIKEYIIAAGSYPIAAVWIAMVYFVILRHFYKRPYMSPEDLKKKIEELRKNGPSPINRPESGGPLSIDPVSMSQIDEMI